MFDLTASGYGSIDNIIINANNVLPVDLISFTGRTEKNKVLLNWKPENKINASHYEIERSTDGIIFKQIDRVNAQGNHVNFYKYTDASPISGVNYYRLKQTDRNNSFKYSYVVSILYDGSEEITVYPKPAKDKINVRLPVTGGTWTATIFSNTGKQIKTTEVSTANPVITVSGLPPGNYILRLKNKSLQKTVKFLKE